MIRNCLENPLTLTGAAAALLLAGIAACGPRAGVIPRSKSDFRKINPVTPLTAASFANPPETDWPWVFYNIPRTAEPAELRAEIKQMHDAGISGALTGQGYYPNDQQLIAMLEAGNEFGVTIGAWGGPDLGLGPGGAYSIDDENASKALVFAKATVGAGQTFAGPLPALPSRLARPGAAPVLGQIGLGGRPNRRTLVAVLAYRCAQLSCSDSGVSELDRASAIDLTPTVTGKNTSGVLGGTTAGSIRWTAPASPAAAQWLLIAFWSQGAQNRPDRYSVEGNDQFLKNFAASDKKVLPVPKFDGGRWHFPEADFSSPRIRELLKINGGDIFVDSDYQPANNWTNKMPEEVQKRHGYSLIPNLAALFGNNLNFSDGSAPRVRNDLYAVRTDLWIRNHVTRLREWLLREYNYKLRLQPEMGAPNILPEQIEVAAALDRPEHESLAGEDEVDIYRPIASANHMTGNTWYSIECCAVRGMNYAETFADAVIRMHKAYAGGMTKLSYHVYPYRDAPSAGEMWPGPAGGYRNGASTWPGYETFAPQSFGNAWGPREPYWVDARLYNSYFARSQQVLTQGGARIDVAVYMHNYDYPRIGRSGGFTRYWGNLGLERAGYTRDYLDPALLALPNATVSGGRLAVNGPAYKALIVDADLQPATDPVKTSMPLDVAQKIVGYAQAGLPVIIVGTPPKQTEGNTPGDDARLRAVIAKLLAGKTVHRVATEAEAPAKLRELGILPAAEPESASPLLSVRRHDDATRTDYYFLYNQGFTRAPGSGKLSSSMVFERPASCRTGSGYQIDSTIGRLTSNPCIGTGEAIELMVRLEGKGQPYLLDAWTGKITPIVRYSGDGKSVTLRVKLARDQAMIVALSEDPNRFGLPAPPLHVTNTNAEDVVITERGALAIRASKVGTYTTTLSDGSIVHTTIGAVLRPIALTKAPWHLVVEDWQPANPYATTFKLPATETRKIRVELDLKELKPWPDIPELRHTSGVGTYTTAVDLPAGWNGATGATLSLGEVFDTFALAVNGTQVPVEQISAAADIGPYLRAGRNTIAVRVATTLNNRLFVLDQRVSNRGLVQEYGLIGPVVLTPYGQEIVSTRIQ